MWIALENMFTGRYRLLNYQTNAKYKLAGIPSWTGTYTLIAPGTRRNGRVIPVLVHRSWREMIGAAWERMEGSVKWLNGDEFVDLNRSSGNFICIKRLLNAIY